MHEWCLIMFAEAIKNQYCAEKDCYDAIKHLNTKLSKTITNDKDDELETCIDKMFRKDE